MSPSHPVVATDLANLGEIELGRGHADEALTILARAVATYDANDGVQPNEPLARFALARALIATNGDHAHAIALARSALAGYHDRGGGRASAIAEIERWLAQHGERGGG